MAGELVAEGAGLGSGGSLGVGGVEPLAETQLAVRGARLPAGGWWLDLPAGG